MESQANNPASATPRTSGHANGAAGDWPRQLTMRLGVVLERRPGKTRWQRWSVLPHGVIVDGPADDTPRELVREGEISRHLSGVLSLTLHRKEAGDYKLNLESGQPRVFVGMRPHARDRGLPWRAFMVTVSPYEAEGYMHGGEEVVEAVAMPEALERIVGGFVQAHFREERFVKRKRKRHFDEDADATPFARPPGWREVEE